MRCFGALVLFVIWSLVDTVLFLLRTVGAIQGFGAIHSGLDLCQLSGVVDLRSKIIFDFGRCAEDCVSFKRDLDWVRVLVDGRSAAGKDCGRRRQLSWKFGGVSWARDGGLSCCAVELRGVARFVYPAGRRDCR